jgi:hypothetical protein
MRSHLRHRTRPLGIALLSLATWLPGSAAHGGSLAVDRQARLEGARDRVADVRAALEHGTFADRVAALRGVSARLPELPTPTEQEWAAVAGLPRHVGAPVAGLTAAVRRAGELIGPLPRADVEAAVGHLLRGISTLGTRQLRAPAGVAHPSPGLVAARPYALREPAALAAPFLATAAMRRAVESAPEAAFFVAAALDRYLPALPTDAGARTVPRTVEGCDLVSQLPALCVGSEAENVYTSDAALLIDLGGDDTYRNSAGGAPFLPSGDSPVYAPVSVNVDLGGDDLYEATTSLPLRINNVTLPTTVAQGGAVYGTVGILVDSAGDDVYRITSPPPSGARAAAILGQGSGFSAEALLLDAGGDDRYEVDGEGWDTDLGIVAQGVEVGGGIVIQDTPPLLLPSTGGPAAALVDLGGGADEYAIEAGLATPAPGGARPFSRAVSAQGYGYVTTGALLDDGGTDAFRISASATNTGVDAYPANGIVPVLQITGQGFSAAGEGLLLTGSGDTTYSVEAPSEGLAFNVVSSQGTAFLGGLGVVDDIAGNDTYSVVGSMEYEREIVVDDSCECPFALAKFNGYRPTLTNQVQAQGYGGGGVGLVEDHGGDDSYLAVSSERLDLTLRDQLSSPSRAPRLQILGYDPASVFAQGTGNLGAGALVDHGGRDAYTIRSLNVTHALATSENASGEPEAVAHSSAFAFIGGQGATNVSGSSAGILVDAGGSGDRFLASAANPVTTAPNPDGAFQVGFTMPAFQGGAGGTFVAAGESPVIVSQPSQGICAGSPGYRGYGYWSETAPGCDVADADPDRQVSDTAVAGHGTAPGAVGAAPMLSISGDTPGEATASFVGPLEDYDSRDPRLPVGAVLTAPSGDAIPGATVHFTLQFFGGTRWRNQYRVDAVTADDGVARARLPLAFNAQAQDYRWRILATYGGAPGLYPRHVAKAITLTTA